MTYLGGWDAAWKAAQGDETRYLQPVPTFEEGDIISAPNLHGEMVRMRIVSISPPDPVSGQRSMELAPVDED